MSIRHSFGSRRSIAGLVLMLSFALAPRVQAAADGGPTTSSEPEPCVEGIEGGNETICVSGEAPTDPCEDEFGPGWTVSTDPFGNPAGCSCVGFFCDDGGGGGGGGGGTPPPPGGGGGGGDPGDDEPEQDKALELAECFGACGGSAYYEGYGECAEGGYTPRDPTTCAVESASKPGSCAGTRELCYDMNVLPDGQPAVPRSCLDPHFPIGPSRECGLLFTQCEFAWLSYDPPSGSGTSLDAACTRAGNQAVGQCQRQCIGEVYEGSACQATGADGTSVDGTVQITGQCCNAEFDCVSCTTGGGQCTIEDGPTERTQTPIRGVAGILGEILVNEIQPARPLPTTLGVAAGGVLVNEVLSADPAAQQDPSAAPEPGASGLAPSATEPAAGATGPQASSGESTGDPGDPAVGDPSAEPAGVATRVVALEGEERTKLARLGKVEAIAAFAFRLGDDGSFEGIDFLGQRYRGAWQARSGRGSALRLELAAGSEDALAQLLADPVATLGANPDTLRLTGPARIELRDGKDGSHSGRIKLAFVVEAGGRALRGSYAVKLREAVK